MSTPAEVVAEAFAQAQSYASDAEGKLSQFTSAMNAALQKVPLVDLNFTPIAPPSAGSAPTDTAAYAAPGDYTSGTLTTIATMIGTLGLALTTRLAGGTGLSPSVEAAIWDRARARELEIAQQAIDDVTVQAEALGFELPPGVLNEGIRRESNAYFDRVSGLSRDVAVKQAELEQSNMRDAIIATNQYLTSAMAYDAGLSEINERRGRIAVEVYRADVEAFRADVETFRAKVEQDVKLWEVNIKQLEAEMTFIQENAKINTEVTRANLATILEAGKVGAQVYAQLAAAAYSLIHASAAVSASAQDSVSYSYSNDTSDQPAAVTAV